MANVLYYINKQGMRRNTNNSKNILKIIRKNEIIDRKPSNDRQKENKGNNQPSSQSIKKRNVDYNINKMQTEMPVDYQKHSVSELKEPYRADNTVNNLSKIKSQTKNRRSSDFLQNLYPGKGKSVQQILSAFIEILKIRNLISVSSNSYLVEGTKFTRMLSFLICAYSNSDTLHEFYNLLVKDDTKLMDYMRKAQYSKTISHQKHKFKKLLAFSSSIYSFNFSNQEQIKQQNCIKQLQKQHKDFNQEISNLKKRKEEITVEIGKKNNQYTIISYQIEKLQYDFDQYLKREDYIKSSISSKEKVLSEVQRRRNQIAQGFEQKQMKNTVATFEEFKRLEQSIHLFANYIQCHPLGERPYEQSKRANSIERLLLKQSRQLQRILRTNEDHIKDESVERFLKRCHAEYTSIIEQLQNVIKEKTDFINKFTTLILQWRQSSFKKHKILQGLKDSYCLETLTYEYFKQNNLQELKAVGKSNKQGHNLMGMIDNIIKLYLICQHLV